MKWELSDSYTTKNGKLLYSTTYMNSCEMNKLKKKKKKKKPLKGNA